MQNFASNGTDAQRWNFTKASSATTGVTAKYGDAAINGMYVGFGDTTFCLQAAANVGSVSFTFGSDVQAGSSRLSVVEGRSITLSDIFGSDRSSS